MPLKNPSRYEVIAGTAPTIVRRSDTVRGWLHGPSTADLLWASRSSRSSTLSDINPCPKSSPGAGQD